MIHPGVLAFVLLLPAGAPLTADEAVRIALEHSPRMRAAEHQARAARAEAERERPVVRPEVRAEVEGRVQGPRVTFPRAGAGEAVVVRGEHARAALSLDQVLYRAGLGAARDRHAAQIETARLELLRARADLIRDVRRACWLLLGAQAQSEVARNAVDLAREQAGLARVLREAGTVAERDVRASEADLAEAEGAALRAENGEALARANLNRLLGREPSTPLELATPAELPAVPELPDVDGALARRPELRLLQEGIRAARAGAALAGVQDLPSLSGRALVAARTPSAFERSTYYSAGLVVTWSPFDFGRTRRDVEAARARAAQLEAQLEDAKLGIRLEVEKAWNDMREARARLDAAERQTAAADASAGVARLRYEAGAATQVEVSGALLALSRARAARAQARFDLHAAAADYAHATGTDAGEASPR